MQQVAGEGTGKSKSDTEEGEHSLGQGVTGKHTTENVNRTRPGSLML
jgi:hypothetical protein